ncbi:ribosome maturation factor RimP [bacterium]|nr:ribosome maturation factor RimP [bacterium]
MRTLSEQERRILELVEPEARALGLDIVRIRVMGTRRPVVQIMTEQPDGTVDVEHCASLSRQVSPVLDAADPISGEYVLEVSSPGIDRPLTRAGDFAKWVGHEVRVELAQGVDGRRRFHGFIAGEEGGVARLDLKDGGTAELALSEMVKANLVLTDRLIAETQARGQALDFVDDGAFDEIRTEDPDAAPARPAGRDGNRNTKSKKDLLP